MKKNKYIYIMNWLLLFSIPFILITSNVKTDTINSKIDTKNLKTNLLEAVIPQKELNQTKQQTEIKDIEINKDNLKDNNKETVEKKVVVEQPVIKEEEKEQKEEVLETFTGDLSYYHANCSGCSGFTSTGLDVRDGRLYYNDSTYGDVRIIASGAEIPKYSIVRIKNSSLGSEILAIVLDRGGNIGQGKKFIVDVLTNSMEAKGGVDYGVSIEVIRKGI